jgi:hypothetical protein
MSSSRPAGSPRLSGAPWQAVRAAFPRVAETIPRKAKFRDADAITGGTWEEFERVMQRAGYFAGGLRKIDAAQQIAPLMDPERNTSPSFQVLRRSLAALAVA